MAVINVNNAAQYAIELFSIALIFRLLWLKDRQNGVYMTFVAFLTVQLGGAVAYFACIHWRQLDYRIFYLAVTAMLAVLSLVLAYSLAKAVLAELPGILRFSRILLNIVFALAIVLAFSTAKTEYWLAPAKNNLHQRLDQLIYAAIVADKGISMASIIVLIAILAFILWFPVKMSRNLAIFSVGLVVYFSSKTALVLFSIYTNSETRNVLDVCVSGVLIVCFVYWIAFINAEGQTAEVRMGHGWHKDEQEKLIGQLEALNGALLRSSQQLRSSQHLPL